MSQNRSVSSTGPFPDAVEDTDVVFVGSTAEYEEARQRKANSPVVEGTTIAIFRSRRLNDGSFFLYQYDPPPPPPVAEEDPEDNIGTVIGWDLFRVPNDLLERPGRSALSARIAQLLHDFGQQGGPSGTHPP